MRGVSLAHRTRLTKSQRAVIAADIDDGIRGYQPSQTELAKALNVSTPMVQQAKRLSPLARQAVMGGKATVGHYTRQMAAALKPKTAEPVDHAKSDGATLRSIIQRYGVDYVVDMAAAMEAAE